MAKALLSTKQKEVNKLSKELDMMRHTYRTLEVRIYNMLHHAINDSDYNSKFIEGKAIEVNLFDYVELTVVGNNPTFIDKHGYQHSLFADCDLEDLINILQKR